MSIAIYLQSPQAIRDRTQQLFELARADKLTHFRYRGDRLQPTADYVLQVMRENYPDLNVPFHSRWRHFGVGKVDRAAELQTRLAGLDPVAQARAKFDLVILSVLLDAGAGAVWRYREASSGQVFQRSEGLAVASFCMCCEGAFSGDRAAPLQATAAALQQITESDLAQAFQVSPDNPLIGLAGRVALLQQLGHTLAQKPGFFGAETPRPGNLVDYLLTQAEDRQLPAPTVLTAVLQGLGDIWPGRITLDGVNLGDVWPHPALPDTEPGSNLVPLHKLSQWLTYSLLEPLQDLGLEITHLDQLTGLAEYRNGGLCVDLGLLEPKHDDVLRGPHLPSSEVIVEWRSLTLVLLDQIADAIRAKLGLSATELPLVKVLEGGTWAAGRKIAAELRPGGDPPISIQSDGTVF
ncbi:URC4/urg3 family protein [Thermoleptolyngbya sp. C42_A2020_037]|uniref:URC4/urg3 family protein n=1 Tax=Thermoleptolyngbya sp. C42_A2020_037 TaxID=2747799 RepID=UPI0019D972BF|nr:URC4/urg3 family protein [Thermoleptolyngbya sp. C42_A2020_037]MBF2084982.1 URC4/urg3 family protein [Thermoleptolyngbya sp. C42_A2020_037]